MKKIMLATLLLLGATTAGLATPAAKDGMIPKQAGESYSQFFARYERDGEFLMTKPIRSKWMSLHGSKGKELGLSVADCQIPKPSPQGTSGAYSAFQYGWICSSPLGTCAVYGTIGEQYLAAGLSAGRYGFPKADAVTDAKGVTSQEFEGGTIVAR